MAPQDSQNCGRDFAKRKQRDADFAANTYYAWFIIDIESNTSVGGLTLDPAGMHCPLWDDAFVSSYRQTAGIVFTHRPKIRFFAPQGRLVAPIQFKLGRADGHWGPLVPAKFHLNRHSAVGMRPHNIKNFHLLAP